MRHLPQPSARGGVVRVVLLGAAEPAAELQRRGPRGARACERVADQLARVGEVGHQVDHQRQGLLCRVQARGFAAAILLDRVRVQAVFSAAVPALFALRVGQRDRLEGHRGPVAAELRRGPALVPGDRADVLQACALEGLAPEMTALHVGEDRHPPAADACGLDGHRIDLR
jgi:hypothetical protein